MSLVGIAALHPCPICITAAIGVYVISFIIYTNKEDE